MLTLSFFIINCVVAGIFALFNTFEMCVMLPLILVMYVTFPLSLVIGKEIPDKFGIILPSLFLLGGLARLIIGLSYFIICIMVGFDPLLLVTFLMIMYIQMHILAIKYILQELNIKPIFIQKYWRKIP